MVVDVTLDAESPLSERVGIRLPDVAVSGIRRVEAEVLRRRKETHGKPLSDFAVGAMRKKGK